MDLGRWFRRIAAATVLTFGFGFALNGAALGLELPAVDPALGSQTALPGDMSLLSTSALPVDPQKVIGPTVPPTPVTTAPPGPTGPSAPAESVSPTSTNAQATVARVHRGSLASTGRSRNLVNGDRTSTSAASGSAAAAQRVRRASASSRRGRPHRRAGLSSSSPGFQLFHPSQLAYLGRVFDRQAPPSRSFGGFSASATGSATWAPPLLAIMLLTGLGGLLRIGLPARPRA